jgi:elongation factor Ts
MGKIGEKIELRRAKFINVEDGFVSTYIHFGSKLGALVGIEGAASDEAENIGKSIAMQVVAMNPLSIKREDIENSVIEKEKEIYRSQAGDNKPANIIEKIIQNKVEKFYQDHCLLEQEFIQESSKTVNDLLMEYKKKNNSSLEIVSVVRYQLGEE